VAMSRDMILAGAWSRLGVSLWATLETTVSARRTALQVL
jgi:hypothetical protein